MLDGKRTAAALLAAALAAQAIGGGMVFWQSLDKVTAFALAAEAADDDPERGKHEKELILAEDMGISGYAVRKMSISGNSPFVENTVYLHSDVFADRTIVNGIDVSRYQYDIDWQAAAQAGVEYAIIRVGYRGYGAAGGMGADPYFTQNIQGAAMAGIDAGVYFFSQATTVEEAVEEAKYTLDKIAGYPITLPVVIDFEYASVNGKAGGRLYDARLSKEDATAVCLAFCETVESAGYKAMLYANSVMLNNNLHASWISSKYKIWLANYTSMTSYAGAYDFWQYTSKGKVRGINGNVDCNFWYQRAGEENNSNTGEITLPEIPVVEGAPIEQVTGVISTERTDTQIHLVWNALKDVTGYEVYRYNSGTGTYEQVGIISNASISTYTDTGLVPGTTYDYVIRGYRVNASGEFTYGDYSESLVVTTAPKMVTGFSVGNRTATKIRLNWDLAEGISGYRIFRYNEETKEYEKVKTLSDGMTTTWVDTKVEPGKTYEYIIKTYIKDDAATCWSDGTEPVTVKTKPGAVEGFAMSVARKDKVRLSWKPARGADGYCIYRYNGGTKTYEKIKTIGAGDTLTWVNSGLKSNTTYKYKIKAYIQDEDGIRYTGSFGDTVTAKTLK